MAFSSRDPIEKSIEDTQTKLIQEIHGNLPKLNSEDSTIQITKNGPLIVQIPDVYVSSEDMSVNIASETQLKIQKYNFLQEANEARKQNKLTQETLEGLLTKYPEAKQGVFSRVNGIVKSLQNEIKERNKSVKEDKKNKTFELK